MDQAIINKDETNKKFTCTKETKLKDQINNRVYDQTVARQSFPLYFANPSLLTSAQEFSLNINNLACSEKIWQRTNDHLKFERFPKILDLAAGLEKPSLDDHL